MHESRLMLGLAVVAVLSLGGCQFKGAFAPAQTQSGSDRGVGIQTQAGWWRPTPVAVRVFPGSRFREGDQGNPVLEARLELLDEMGDPVKAPGVYRFELMAGSLSGADGPRLGKRLYAWDASVQTLADQRDHFDPIIDGYVFRLALDSDEPTRRATVLRVTYQPPGRPRLTAQAPVRNDW